MEQRAEQMHPIFSVARVCSPFLLSPPPLRVSPPLCLPLRPLSLLIPKARPPIPIHPASPSPIFLSGYFFCFHLFGHGSPDVGLWNMS